MRVLSLPLRAVFSGLLLGGGLALSPALHGQDTTANEGGDLVVGGPGKEPGHFQVLEDLTFDPKGALYELDGVRMNNQTHQPEGNLRVEKFDRSGKLLGEIDLHSAPGVAWSEKHQPKRIAADSAGEVFVTVPALDKVLEWNDGGEFERAITVPRAMAITLVGKGAHERLAVVPSHHEVGPLKLPGGNQIVILSLKGAVEQTIALPQAYAEVQDVAADAAGNFYLKAEPNAIYKLSPEGQLLHTYGGNPTTRNSDGSEVLHTVGVDSAGNVYTFAWGNPSLLTRFDADGKTVTQREGQFKWADPWGAHSNYTPLAIDPDDRVWVAATALHDPSYPNFKVQRAVPAIIRTRADFLTVAGHVRQSPLRRLGFRADVRTDLPQNVSFDPARPVPMRFLVAPANRSINGVTVQWHVFDAQKDPVAEGTFEVPLTNGASATSSFQWTPSRYGAYFVQVLMSTPRRAGGRARRARRRHAAFPRPAGAAGGGGRRRLVRSAAAALVRAAERAHPPQTHAERKAGRSRPETHRAQHANRRRRQGGGDGPRAIV